MFRPRFSLFTAVVMLFGYLAAVWFLMPRGVHDGYAGRWGWPFAVQWWTDSPEHDGDPAGGFLWAGFVADLGFYAAAVLALGLVVERIQRSVFGRGEHDLDHTARERDGE